jgi:hypothetical protein
MDLTFGSPNFRIGSLGSIRLSDLIKSGPSAEKKTVTAAILESSVGSSSELNSPVSFMMMENIEDKIGELDEPWRTSTWESNQETSWSAVAASQKSPQIRGKHDWSFMRKTKLFSQASAANSDGFVA